METFVKRLLPGQDIKIGLQQLLDEYQLKAAAIVSAVGSVQTFSLRVSDGKTVISDSEYREIVSMSGILTKDGIHVHLSLSGLDGSVIGGHLMEGCLVNTTLELVLLPLEHNLSRAFDPTTGYKELITK